MSAPLTAQQAQALKLIVESIIEAVAAAGSLGAPGGVIYAALMQYGCSLNQYESIMSALVRAGKLRKQGDLYFTVAA